MDKLAIMALRIIWSLILLVVTLPIRAPDSFGATPTPEPTFDPFLTPQPTPPAEIRITASLFNVPFTLDQLQPINADNVSNIAQLWTLAGHLSTIRQMTFSPDGALLVTTSVDQTVRIWDMQQGAEIAIFGTATSETTYFPAAKPIFSPDGSVLALGLHASNDILLWDVASRSVSMTLSGHHNPAQRLEFSSDGGLLASGACGELQGTEFYTCVDNEVFVWDVATGERIADLHAPIIQMGQGSQQFSPDGRLLAYLGTDGMWLWDVTTRETRAPISVAPNNILNYQFSPDSTMLFLAGGNAGILWDVEANAVIFEFPAQPYPAYANAYTFNGSVLAYADSSVHLWDTQERREIMTLPLTLDEGDMARQLTFDASGEQLAILSTYQTLILNIATNTVSSVYNCRGDTYSLQRLVAFSPDGLLFACQHDDGDVDLWELDDLAHYYRLHSGDYYYAEGSSAYTPDWRLWATQREGVIAVWGVIPVDD
jgi:WD40 repeat protein